MHPDAREMCADRTAAVLTGERPGPSWDSITVPRSREIPVLGPIARVPAGPCHLHAARSRHPRARHLFEHVRVEAADDLH